MRVGIPTPLRSYTRGQAEVAADGGTLAELLVALDQRYPGIRFRMIDEQDHIRPHLRIFVNGEQALGLGVALSAQDEIQILQALSGG